jgi:glutathione S-transferase
MNIKFYMTPGSCSTGIHILLEECDLIFEVYTVNLMAGDQNKPEFLAINPKASIPALVREDGSSLTDYMTICWWLGRQYPEKGLLPDNLEDEIKVMDVISYVVSTIHMQGFARIFTADKFTPHEADYEWVKEQGREIINRGFAIINDLLSDKGYVTETFSIADATLFYVEFWAVKTDIELPPACQKHYQMMLNRMSVRQVLMEEGYKGDL